MPQQSIAVRTAPHPGGLALTSEAVDLLDMPAGARVLDLGCGGGETLAALMESHAITACGVDRRIGALRHASSTTPLLSFLLAEAAALPIADRSFDVILAECSLTLMTPLQPTLRELNRVLAAGGSMLVNDLYYRHAPAPEDRDMLDRDALFEGVLTEPALRQLFANNGFRVDYWQDHSDVLKGYNIQSLAAEGCRGCDTNTIDLMELHLALARAKLGYYQLVARRED